MMESNENTITCLACGFEGGEEYFVKSADKTVRKLCKACVDSFVEYKDHALLEQYLTPKNNPDIAEEKDPVVRLALIKRTAARVKQLQIKVNRRGWKE